MDAVVRTYIHTNIHTHRDFDAAVKDRIRAATLTRWFMRRQRLGGYRVALQIADSEELVVSGTTDWKTYSIPYIYTVKTQEIRYGLAV
jgi:hypothetical protein